MLPGLSSVLRRDKERQRASGHGGVDGGSAGYGFGPGGAASNGGGAAPQLSQSPPLSAISAPIASPTTALPQGMAARRPTAAPPPQGQLASLQSSPSSPPRTSGLLPEEHRARERERERLARAQLSNTHTNQLMANRQMQRSLQEAPTAQTQAQPAQTQAQAEQQTRYSSSHMESSVTRLLVATKMLLEALTKWSLGQRTESQVSDIYVRLGNDFNVANLAFGSYGIDMSDLSSVPDDLRDCLERCLSEDASPQTLEVHLPRIREIIIGLLQGLKGKQAEYKQLLIQRRASARSSKNRAQTLASEAQSGANSRTSVSSAALGETGASAEVTRTGSNKSAQSSMQGSFEEDVRRSVAGRRPMNAPPLADASLPPVPRPSSGASQKRKSKRDTADRRIEEEGGFSPASKTASPSVAGDLSLPEVGTQPVSASATDQDDGGEMIKRSQTMGALNGGHPDDTALGEIGDAADPSVRALKSRDALERRASKRFSAYTFNKMGVGLNQGLGMSSYALPGSAMNSPVLERSATGTPLKSSSRRQLGRSSSDLQSPDTPTRTKDRGLAAETIREAADPPQRKKGSRSSPRHSPRGPNASLSTLAPPPVPSIKEQFNSSTESLPFVDAQSPTRANIPDLDGSSTPAATNSQSSLPPIDIEAAQSIPPVPPLPTAKEQAKLDAAHNKQSADRWASSSRTPTATVPNAAKGMLLFLQLGRQTKKVHVDLDPTLPFHGLSTGKLRMLFMDRFSYSPGKEDFPAIYVKDERSGVTYEMEDLTEVTDGTVLTLNIEPLDQVKQHLDLTLGGITRELRDLKTAMQDRDRMWARRLSSAPVDGLASNVSAQGRISDAQFAKAGARVAQYKRATMFFARDPADTSITEGEVAEEKGADEVDADAGDQGAKDGASQTRPNSVGWQFAGDQLKKQYDEVLNVRRQLAIMAQVQDDFKSDVGGLLGNLREQAKKVRAIAATEVPTERNFIISGKARLDSNSQEILTLVEDLLDLVDDLKADVIQRGVKPKPHTMKKLGEDIERATRGLDDLSKYVDLVKPSWKKTWEMELQNIVDEQEFLNHQEGLIADLKEDHANLQDVFHNIQEVVKLRGANKYNLMGNTSHGDTSLLNVSLRTYVPPVPEEGHEGLSTVMMEVKSQSVDHEKRLKALQAAERLRLKELTHRKEHEDGFQNELTTFVDGKALRKTGGYQETERVRGRRDKLTMQAMFGGGGSGGAPIEASAGPAPKRLVLGTNAGAGNGGGGGGGGHNGGSAAGGSSSGGSQSGEVTQFSSSTSVDGVPLDSSGDADDAFGLGN